MNHLKEFLEYISESLDTTMDTIDDCFLNFCDEYKLDMGIESGYKFKGGYLDPGLFDEVLHRYKDIDRAAIEKVYKVSFRTKLWREHNGHISDLSDIWKDNINIDFKRDIKRVERMTGLEPTFIPELDPGHWQIVLYFPYI